MSGMLRIKSSFAPIESRPLCKWCGKRLQEGEKRTAAGTAANDWTDEYSGTGTFGRYGDGLFCTLRCGYEFAWFVLKTGSIPTKPIGKR